ncbi:hypothetical protein TGARI_211860 [Toxoplasma gondii ARI]|uniref:Transmembrane protein n=1 Tax=Toxoplasma gondii ARI TaxID=1074872 RepID=A0A139XU52_TOXGO|nr:hypothetical protein TGARI_211860 [Toxoplasma gondii ARI]
MWDSGTMRFVFLVYLLFLVICLRPAGSAATGSVTALRKGGKGEATGTASENEGAGLQKNLAVNTHVFGNVRATESPRSAMRGTPVLPADGGGVHEDFSGYVASTRSVKWKTESRLRRQQKQRRHTRMVAASFLLLTSLLYGGYLLHTTMTSGAESALVRPAGNTYRDKVAALVPSEQETTFSASTPASSSKVIRAVRENQQVTDYKRSLFSRKALFATISVMTAAVVLFAASSFISYEAGTSHEESSHHSGYEARNVPVERDSDQPGQEAGGSQELLSPPRDVDSVEKTMAKSDVLEAAESGSDGLDLERISARSMLPQLAWSAALVWIVYVSTVSISSGFRELWHSQRELSGLEARREEAAAHYTGLRDLGGKLARKAAQTKDEMTRTKEDLERQSREVREIEEEYEQLEQRLAAAQRKQSIVPDTLDNIKRAGALNDEASELTQLQARQNYGESLLREIAHLTAERDHLQKEAVRLRGVLSDKEADTAGDSTEERARKGPTGDKPTGGYRGDDDELEVAHEAFSQLQVEAQERLALLEQLQDEVDDLTSQESHVLQKNRKLTEVRNKLKEQLKETSLRRANALQAFDTVRSRENDLRKELEEKEKLLDMLRNAEKCTPDNELRGKILSILQ